MAATIRFWHGGLIIAGFLAVAPAHAQTPPQPEQRPLTIQEQRDGLFARLKAAPSPEAARPLAAQIERIFERSGSDTADLLFKRANDALGAQDSATALDLLDFVIQLRPEWAEPYHRRAVIHFRGKDEDGAMRDIRAALAREPRHYHAYLGLGAMMQAMGNRKAAYRAYLSAYELHPNLPGLKETLERLKSAVEGSPA